LRRLWSQLAQLASPVFSNLLDTALFFVSSVYIGAGGKKQESRWACRRSGSSHVSVGLTGPAQPYLKPAQTI
jgi:hypothetical protein